MARFEKGELFRLVSEAVRIRNAYLFDSFLAVHTSLVEPLPHQITAVYEEMLPRQPLRFLLADDPGAGKTIMTGLLIKELMLRGDLNRCLIVCPGNLVEQWQDELNQRFHLSFEILTNQRIETASTGNAFLEIPLCIARLDKLARDQELQEKLKQADWDLVVCDEAHKMSASYFGGQVKYTKRHRLGQLLSRLTRHFLLLTATPHNGKEEDFQLFMSLLDNDRFEGRFRDGVHTVDVSDLMRRLVKEELYRLDGTPLFPERLAYTVTYTLSLEEATLYKAVTDYVKEEFNRADALENEGRRGTVGFALTILQRRLASSPEAIYRSLKSRRQRLESRLSETEFFQWNTPYATGMQLIFTDDDWDDLEEAPEAEVESIEAAVLDQATAARTIAELEAEISTLRQLERQAHQLLVSGTDRKWEELSSLLQSRAMVTSQGERRKLVIFTEHRATLDYLAQRIRTLLGRWEAVVTIHGGLSRKQRRLAQETFIQDKEAYILVATDAAGEGINLQQANLMVNYDLPWNPNRIEQRFGRIHRIGQKEVCHLWNLVAAETREGQVYQRLLEKLEEARTALGGRVFDVLGRITFDDRPLKNLLLEAIRYGEQPQVQTRLYQAVDNAFDRQRLSQLLEERALVRNAIEPTRVAKIRTQMERSQARRLQPHFIASFFRQAFSLLGGTIYEREPKRYEITHVPTVIRRRGSAGQRQTVLPRYQRITFNQELMTVPGKPEAVFVCPGHPLLDATLDIILERYGDLLQEGVLLLDPADYRQDVRFLCYIQHSITDGQSNNTDSCQVISKQLQFVEVDSMGRVREVGPAPHLDYRALTASEQKLLTPKLERHRSNQNVWSQALSYAEEHLVPWHSRAVQEQREDQVLKVMAAVKNRLTKEINYWDHRAADLKAQEVAGSRTRISWVKAAQRAEQLTARLKIRMKELEQKRCLTALAPKLVGKAVVVPAGLLSQLQGEKETPGTFARDTKQVEQLAMQAVLAAERAAGYVTRDVSADKCGYDIESRHPRTGRLRFIEVKGRSKGATTVTVTKNEILTGLNKPQDYFLALVEVDGTDTEITYLPSPFTQEPDFAATSVNYSIKELMSRCETAFETAD